MAGDGDDKRNPCCGCLMFMAAPFILLWNEFRYVFMENAIAYADEHVVYAGCSADPALSGKLVFASCPVTRARFMTGGRYRLLPSAVVTRISATATAISIAGACGLRIFLVLRASGISFSS